MKVATRKERTVASPQTGVFNHRQEKVCTNKLVPRYSVHKYISYNIKIILLFSSYLFTKEGTVI